MRIPVFPGFNTLENSALEGSPLLRRTDWGQQTELAKSLAQFLFGDEEACIRFDMSEYNHEHSDQRLVGAPRVRWI